MTKKFSQARMGIDYCCTSKLKQGKIRGRKRNGTFNGRAIYSYAASVLQELRSSDNTGCEKHELNFDAYPLSEIPQTKTFSLVMKKMYLNKMRIFLYETACKKMILAARGKARAQCTVRAVKKQFSLEERVAPPARVAGKIPPPFTPRRSRRLGKRASIRLSQLNLQLASKAPPLKK